VCETPPEFQQIGKRRRSKATSPPKDHTPYKKATPILDSQTISEFSTQTTQLGSATPSPMSPPVATFKCNEKYLRKELSKILSKKRFKDVGTYMDGPFKMKDENRFSQERGFGPFEWFLCSPIKDWYVLAAVLFKRNTDPKLVAKSKSIPEKILTQIQRRRGKSVIECDGIARSIVGEARAVFFDREGSPSRHISNEHCDFFTKYGALFM